MGLIAGAWECSRVGKSNRDKITANFCGRMVVEELWQRWIVDVKREDVKEVEEVKEGSWRLCYGDVGFFPRKAWKGICRGVGFLRG